MNRNLRAFVITVGVSGALLGTAFLGFRTTWRTATEAEVRAAIAPELLAVDQADLQAQDRLDRLNRIAARMDFRELFVRVEPDAEVLDRFLKREDQNIREVRALVAEGPFQRDAKPAKPAPFTEAGTQRHLTRTLALAGDYEAKAGRPKEAVSLLLLAYGVVGRLGDARNSVLTSLSSYGNETLLYSEIRDTLRFLPESELAVLAAGLQDPPGEREAMRRTIRSEFQSKILPILPDPVAWARRQAPGDDPTSLLAGLTTGKREDPSSGFGNYDALQTARDASRIYALAMQNADRSGGSQDTRGYIYARELFDSLPVRRPAPKGRFPKYFNDLRYRLELGRVPNTLGRAILSTHPANRAWILDYQSIRTAREGLRTLIGLQRFRLKVGRRAASLAEVVESGILPSLPSDPLGSGSLRYDSKKGRLWSVGWDGIDGGGLAKSFGTWVEPDMVWPVP
ncbi:MAG: hypothetical protein ACO1SV_06355 [Fimbriimonas sp.]